MLYARPNLSKEYFKQIAGTELILSGDTKIRKENGLLLYNGSAYIPFDIASNYAENKILRVVDNKIVLTDENSQATEFFDTDRETTRDGLPKVTVGGDNTLVNFIENYFFPDVPPTIALTLNIYERAFGDGSDGAMTVSINQGTHPIKKLRVSSQGDGVFDVLVFDNDSRASVTHNQVINAPSAIHTPTNKALLKTEAFYYAEITTTNDDVFIEEISVIWRNEIKWKIGNLIYDNPTAILQGSGFSKSFSEDRFFEITDTFNTVDKHRIAIYYPLSFGMPMVYINDMYINSMSNENLGGLTIVNNYTNILGYTNDYVVIETPFALFGKNNIKIL